MKSERNLNFANQAAPIAWYEVAKLLHENATELYKARSSKITYTNKGITTTHYTVNRSVFLLAGFAMENLLKAYLIYENPEYIEGGRLSNKLASHKLSLLQERCNKVPYKNRYRLLFQTLEAGLNSWARYPCGLHAESNTNELHATPEFWEYYNKGFVAYSSKLESMLEKKWKGAYGEVTSVKFA